MCVSRLIRPREIGKLKIRFQDICARNVRVTLFLLYCRAQLLVGSFTCMANMRVGMQSFPEGAKQ